MDISLMASSPAIILANHYQFAPDERVHNGPVLSCMQLWCHSGAGTIIANGQSMPLPPGGAVLLPWAHDIVYQAARREPMLVSGIHVVAGLDDALDPSVIRPMHRGEPRSGVDEGEHPLRARIWPLTLNDHPVLAHLSEYALHAYLRGASAGLLRQLGALLVAEWQRALSARASAEPEPLARARAYLASRLGRRIPRAELARASGVSMATLQRLTAAHLRLSPSAWAQQLRLDAAAQLLAHSRVGLAEIASRSGFYDAFHFSRAFKSRYGEAPAAWRRRQRPL